MSSMGNSEKSLHIMEVFSMQNAETLLFGVLKSDNRWCFRRVKSQKKAKILSETK